MARPFRIPPSTAYVALWYWETPKHFEDTPALGPGGFLFVVDLHNRDVAVFDTNGKFKYRFLQPGIATGQLYFPAEIRFDPWDGMCITDEGNARVEVYRQ